MKKFKSPEQKEEWENCMFSSFSTERKWKKKQKRKKREHIWN